MIYVGIDVHKTRSTLVALDPSTGEYCECTVLTQRDELVAALMKVPEPWHARCSSTSTSCGGRWSSESSRLRPGCGE